MSVNDTYIRTQSGNNFQQASLSSAIAAQLSSGLATLTLTSALVFDPEGVTGIGRLRFNGSYIQWSTDGSTWHSITDRSYEWAAGSTHVQGDMVMYQGAWWLCTAVTTQTTPAPGAAWRLLTLGSVVLFASNTTAFSEALESTSDCIIYLSGSMTGSINATVSAPNIIIYSDEATTINASSITLTMGSGCNVYWHCKGTTVYNSSQGTVAVTATTGNLWIENMNAATGLTMSGNVYYQWLRGPAGSGGLYSAWAYRDNSTDCVPKDLSALTSAPYSDTAKVYVNNGGYQYVTLETVSENIAEKTAKYWHIDAQGLAANKPVSATEGYQYYATDTGDLYRYGASAWDAPVHIQGPQGSPGSSGASGSNGVSPSVSMTSVGSGVNITITDATHPSGQTVTVLNGSNGSSPTLTTGTIATVSYGSAASASITGVFPAYAINLWIPEGRPGDTVTWGGISGTLSNQLDLAAALDSKQNLITSDNKLDYDLVSGGPTVGSGTLNISSGGSVYTYSPANNADIDVEIATVNDVPITINQGGVSKGRFTLNQASSMTIELDAGGGGGTVTWGGITGTLSNQTDLNSALNAKQDATKVYSMSTPVAILDYSSGDYQRMTLAANLTITSVANISSGQGLALEVNNAGGYALSAGGSELIATSDTGTYVVGFFHNGASVQVFKDKAAITGLT